MPRMEAVDAKPFLTESEFTGLVRMISKRTSVDFLNYKKNFLKRRLHHQLMKYRLSSWEEYSELLAEGRIGSPELINDFTIHVTRFFRDPALFEYLNKRVFRRLWKRHLARGDREFRIWVMGCSTGEEAYSVAISLLEAVRPDLTRDPIRIFATDLDEKAIEYARRGEYGSQWISGVKPELRKRYFLPGSRGKVVPRLRRMILFGRHDLLRNPSILHLDMVFCRNVLIFLDRSIQHSLYMKFYDSLKPGGILVMGRAESPTPHSRQGRFEPLSLANRVFRKQEVRTDPEGRREGKKP